MEIKEIFKSCCKCGKVIDENEYVVNWGLCEECLNSDYREYLKENVEISSVENYNDLF